jgi:mono/diheme cytochrome c family protein
MMSACRVLLAVFVYLLVVLSIQAGELSQTDLEQGKQIYLQGLLPSGETVTGVVQGDITLSGKQVICGTCHRRSGMGASEGEQVIPAVAGHMIFKPLRLPTSSNPLAPTQRPAYTIETLKRAIVTGIDANGRPLDPLMPRYPLSDSELDKLIGYMGTLSAEHSDGVDDTDIHFATIIAGDVSPEARQALIDVMQVYVTQKNSETRHETFRAQNAPWHKKWLFEPYRKWVMHIWELQGPRETWDQQLKAYYREQPVFAVLSGIGEGSWQPMHDFCQQQKLPCLFPTTELPVIHEDDFYPVYLSKGMTLEGQLVDLHLQEKHPDLPIVQVLPRGDLKAQTASKALLASHQGKGVRTIEWDDRSSAKPNSAFWQKVIQELDGAALVLWMDSSQLDDFWPLLVKQRLATPVYLSSTLFGVNGESIPASVRDGIFLTSTREIPGRTDRLLLRSTGWLKVKRVYAPEFKDIQANAYLALKVFGDALTHIRGYFYKDYLIERIEHTMENAPYTSVYPRLSLAPEQRFAAKGGYVTRFSRTGEPELVAVTDWLIPR